MPEVVEVRKYADFLKKYLKNKSLEKIEILKGRYKRKPFDFYDKINELFPIKIIDVKTKGKFLYFVLEKNIYFFSTLGLKGGWIFYNNKGQYIFPHLMNESYKKIILNNLNIGFKVNNGTIFYYDTLSFGTFKIIFNDNNLIKKLNTIGEDIMDESTTFDIFKNKIMKKNNLEKIIATVLVNQKVISGIGNYLRADILWLSKISPFRKVKDLDDNDLQNIYNNAKLLTCGEYYKNAKNKLPSDYNRNFFIYDSEYNIYDYKVLTKQLVESGQKRTVYWVDEIQK